MDFCENLYKEGEEEVYQDIKNWYSDVKNYTGETLNIPITYILFLIALFLAIHDEFINYINIDSWVPNRIRIFILEAFNIIYSNYFMVFIILVSLIIIVSVLAEITMVFEKILPKPYIDSTQSSWNQYTAINRILKILVFFSTIGWVYFFIAQVILNNTSPQDNFLIFNSNYWNDQGTFNLMNLALMYILLFVNILLAIYYILRALFVIRIPIESNRINIKYINDYIIIASHHLIMKNGIEHETLLLKPRYFETPKYLLVSGQQNHQKLSDNELTLRKLDPLEIEYKVLNTSNDFSEIVFHFESIKK